MSNSDWSITKTAPRRLLLRKSRKGFTMTMKRKQKNISIGLIVSKELKMFLLWKIWSSLNLIWQKLARLKIRSWLKNMVVKSCLLESSMKKWMMVVSQKIIWVKQQWASLKLYSSLLKTVLAINLWNFNLTPTGGFAEIVKQVNSWAGDKTG